MRTLPVHNPVNRFHDSHVEYDAEHVPDAGFELIDDHSKSVLSKNRSPDIGFTFSVNPYRGCVHACAYCYARPGHEYLGLGAGTDFDRKIVVKRDAARLLREAFAGASWRRASAHGTPRVVFSGVTDCYQPPEKQLQITRECLQVCSEFRVPVGLITKSALIERDLDVLGELQARAGAHVAVSMPFFDAELARALEPYAPAPARRLRVIERLAEAGIEVSVNVAPLIPGLSEGEFPRVLAAAQAAGARHAGAVLLRLPGAVAEVFEQRIRVALPLRAEKILRRLREAHGGKLYRAEFGHRQRGSGRYADILFALFERRLRELGMQPHHDLTDPTQAPKATPTSAQLDLFATSPR